MMSNFGLLENILWNHNVLHIFFNINFSFILFVFKKCVNIEPLCIKFITTRLTPKTIIAIKTLINMHIFVAMENIKDSFTTWMVTPFDNLPPNFHNVLHIIMNSWPGNKVLFKVCHYLFYCTHFIYAQTMVLSA